MEVIGTVTIASALVTGLVVAARTNDDGDFMSAGVIGSGVAAALVLAMALVVLLAQGYELPGQEALLRPGEFVLEKTIGDQEGQQ